MSAFFPQLARAVAAGAAMETGRQAVRQNNGLGFAWGEYGGGDYNDDFAWDFGGGDYWDWFGYGSGYADLPFLPMEFDYGAAWADPGISASGNDGRYDFDWNQYWSDWLGGNVMTIDTFAPSPLPRAFDPFALPGFDPYREIWPGFDDRSFGGSIDPGTQQLPGYCPRGTYHPVDDPFNCVPFPETDQTAKKRAQQQQQARQQAANALRKAQQQADRQCPKDPQGRAVWRNPQTGKCELVPQCPQGTKFDPATRRCLTTAQAKEIYGDNNWLLWLLIAAGVLVVANSGSDSGGRRRR